MDLEELRAYLAVVEARSFLGAARSLGTSRTTLRRKVASLEARAGVPLLESGQQGVTPTDAGRLLAGQGRAMIQEASALLSSIREVGQAPSGTVRVVLPVGLPPQVLTPMLGTMRAMYPRVSFHLQLSNDPLSEPLTDIDMAVHFGESSPGGRWTSCVVLRARERLIASKDYLARRGEPRTIDDLRRHDLLAWQAPGEDPRVLRAREGTSLRVEPALIATDIHLIRRCCIAGLGIGLVPDALLPDPGIPSGTLVPVLPDIIGQDRTVRVSVPKALAEIPRVKVILDQVQRSLGAL